MQKKQLSHNGYVADFFVNAKYDPPVYHYIITSKESPEIVSWGQERSMDAAEAEALRCMKEFTARKTG